MTLNLSDLEVQSLFHELHRIVPLLQEQFVNFLNDPKEASLPGHAEFMERQKDHIDRLIMIHSKLASVLPQVGKN